MPRPKPNMNALLDTYILSLGYKIWEVSDTDNFNTNTGIMIICKKNPEHIFRTNITDLKRGKMNLSDDCPHCKKITKDKSRGVPYSYIESWFKNNNLTIVNKQEFYNRWTDFIEYSCNECKNREKIKSVGNFEKKIKKGDTKYSCEHCKLLSRGLVSDVTFRNIVDERFSVITSTPSELESIYNVEISENLKEKFENSNWKIIKFNGTRNKGDFQCKLCGGVKNAPPHSFFSGRGNGCKMCLSIQKKNEIHEKIKNLCEQSQCYPLKTHPYVSVDSPIQFKCNKCGFEFDKMWIRMGRGEVDLKCPECSKRSNNMKNEIANWIKSVYDGEVEIENRKIIAPKEIDILIPDKKIGIEFCGNIWHSSKYKEDSYYHRDKMIECNKNGFRLITIFEDEWVDKTEIVKSRLKNALGLTHTRLYARKCIVKIIPNNVALSFCEEHHIQGKGQSRIAYGLYHEDDLVSVMTFAKPNAAKKGRDYDWELNRFCTKVHMNVIGGASKLFSAFKKENNGIVVSFCDLRWGTGGIYETLNMDLVSKTRPNYFYIGRATDFKRKHRFNYTKQKLLKKFGGSITNTEKEIAEHNELYQIHDCGHLKFQYTI